MNKERPRSSFNFVGLIAFASSVLLAKILNVENCQSATNITNFRVIYVKENPTLTGF